MRSAGEAGWRPRVTPEPGSSGWSGGRFGSIGRRSAADGAGPALGWARRRYRPGSLVLAVGRGASSARGPARPAVATRRRERRRYGRSGRAARPATSALAGGGRAPAVLPGPAGTCVVLPRMSVSIMASRSTTCPSVPCTASSESWVFFSICLRSATSRVERVDLGRRAAAGAREVAACAGARDGSAARRARARSLRDG